MSTSAGDRPSSPNPRSRLGRAGEELALAHFRALGFELVTRNYRTRHGEIDLIVFDGRTLVFVEVKTRSAARRLDRGAITPLEGLRAAQQRRLRRLAGAWLAQAVDRPRAQELRFDAVGIVLDEAGKAVRLDHVEGMF